LKIYHYLLLIDNSFIGNDSMFFSMRVKFVYKLFYF